MTPNLMTNLSNPGYPINDGDWVRIENPDGSVEERNFYNADYIPPVPEVPAITKISVGSFRRRLTLDEKLAITGSTEVICQVLLDDLAASSFVDLTSLELKAGLEALVGLVILEAPRVAELLVDGTREEV